MAGCGFGYLVKHLMIGGFTDVWGCDISQWAIAQGQLATPAIAIRLVVADCTNRSSLNALRTTAGLTGNSRFRLVITEDMLPAADATAEAQTMLTELRRVAQDMVHMATCMQVGEHKNPDGSVSRAAGAPPHRVAEILWETATGWKAIINNSNEMLLDVETGEVLT